MPNQVHNSITHHLATELALLHALERRSKEQHRSQIFLQRVRRVHRLGRLVQGAFERIDGSSEDLRGERALPRFLTKLVASLIAASDATSQVVELHYFLPLHTLLLGIYARLFAIASNLAAWLALDMFDILAGRSDSKVRREETVKQQQADNPIIRIGEPTEMDGMVTEMGTKVSRPAEPQAEHPAASISSTTKKSQAPVRARRSISVEDDTDTIRDITPHPSTPFQAAGEPASTGSQEAHTRSRLSEQVASSRPVKRRRNDVIDDIFGF